MKVKGGALSGATFFSMDSMHKRRARISLTLMMLSFLCCVYKTFKLENKFKLKNVKLMSN